MEWGDWESMAHGFLAAAPGCLTVTAGGVGALAGGAGGVSESWATLPCIRASI